MANERSATQGLARTVDVDSAELAVSMLLAALGFNPASAALVDTPKRVAKALREMTSGYAQDPRAILSKSFDCAGHNEIVALKDIEFSSLCEHHLLPFTGTAHVAYIAKDKVVGLSKLARLVECHARRLQLQERMGKDIADDLMKYLSATAAICIIQARHQCMHCRGVRQQRAVMVTSAVRGQFKDDASARVEVTKLLLG